MNYYYAVKELWEFVHRLVNNEERIKVVSKDPDNLLVSWIVSFPFPLH
jgi:hypothetical protein